MRIGALALFAVLSSGCGGREDAVDVLVARALVEAGCRIKTSRGRVLQLECGDRSKSSMDLTNLDRQLRGLKAPQEREGAVRQFVRGALTAASTQSDDACPRDALLLSIKTRAFVEATMQRLPPEARLSDALWTTPLAGDLVALVAVDLPDAISAVSMRKLARWKVTGDDALTIATSNLERMTPQAPTRVQTAAGRPAVRYDLKDNYDAARILVPALRKRVQDALGGDAVYAIPTRDALVAVAAADASAVAELRTWAHQSFERDSYAITSHLLRYANGGWRTVD